MKILITGGGTGGHIYPGIAIAKEFQKRDADTEILFVGTVKGLETQLVPAAGFPLKTVTVAGLKRKLSFENIKTIVQTGKGLMESNTIISRFKPQIVIGTGGYVCGPVVLTAALRNIPTLIHEQNSFPGITNRILARFVDVVALTDDHAKQFFSSRAHIIKTGNPVRPEILLAKKEESYHLLGLSPHKKTILIFGGSRGARSINMAALDALHQFLLDDNLQVLFITGQKDFDFVQARIIENKLQGNIMIKPYLHQMENALSVADLVICRAGATTLAEITAMGIPAILIPYPHATDNHQEYNARSLQTQGAARVILDSDLTGQTLLNHCCDLLQSEEVLQQMSENSKKCGTTDAASKIVNEAYKLLGK